MVFTLLLIQFANFAWHRTYDTTVMINTNGMRISNDAQAFANLELCFFWELYRAKCLYWIMKQYFYFQRTCLSFFGCLFRFGRLFISSFHNMPMLLLAPSIFTHLCICQNCCYCKSFVVDHLFWSIQWKLSRERKRQDNSMRERASVTVAGCKDMKEYDA